MPYGRPVPWLVQHGAGARERSILDIPRGLTAVLPGLPLVLPALRIAFLVRGPAMLLRVAGSLSVAWNFRLDANMASSAAGCVSIFRVAHWLLSRSCRWCLREQCKGDTCATGVNRTKVLGLLDETIAESDIRRVCRSTASTTGRRSPET